MPIILETRPSGSLSVEDFIAYVENDVSLESPEALAQASDRFAMLASDADLVARLFNERIKRCLDGDQGARYTPQSVAFGQGKGFFLRANIWTPLRITGSFRSQEERVFSYRNTHDHNFTFMTVGYFGGGYETDLFEYDPSKVRGFVGERVELVPLGRERLHPGRVMVFRESVDVHKQFPPDELSISLNLMVMKPDGLVADQYEFDLASSTIRCMPNFSQLPLRASAIALAGQLANADTIDILEDLVVDAPCRRVREAATIACARLQASAALRVAIIEKAACDRDEVVRHVARRALQDMAI